MMKDQKPSHRTFGSFLRRRMAIMSPYLQHHRQYYLRLLVVMIMSILGIVVFQRSTTATEFLRPASQVEGNPAHVSVEDAILDKQLLDIYRHLPTTDHGQLPSELRLIWNATTYYKIDLLLESGTANGISTQTLGSLFPQIEFHTFDTDGYNVHDATTNRLFTCCPNVTTHLGDATKLIPNFIVRQQRKQQSSSHNNNNNRRKIGIVIDGPKGQRANRFAAKLLLDFPNVYFVAIHDTAPYWGYKANSIPNTVLYTTWNDQYRQKFGHLDRPYLANIPKKKKHREQMLVMGGGLDLFVRA